jgi:colanic acid biosynthesis glycosyl transferase WcaI
MPKQPTLLLISQVYVPDPAAVGQHLADVAEGLVRRGWSVVVITSARGYDDPETQYPSLEHVNGVKVIRLPLSSFGKRSIAVRLTAQTIFLAQATLRGLFVRNVRRVLVSTSPPMAGVAGWLVSVLRRAPVHYWVMDLNPDQMVVTGKMDARSVPVRVFEWLNRLILTRAKRIIVLDRFMAARVRAKADVSNKLVILPPWAHETHIESIPLQGKAFRKQHGLSGKFVVAYSGNHTPVNPLGTLLAATKRLRDDHRFVFLFIGGGQGKLEVDKAIADGAQNLRSLPYQPLEKLGESLSAADVHVATIGNEVVGVVHPCKIYGAMAVGRPVLTFGPRECHLADVVLGHEIGFHVPHGDVEGAVSALQTLARLSAEQRQTMGARGADAIRTKLSQSVMCAAVCDVLEQS